jgi:hypothetical protein
MCNQFGWSIHSKGLVHYDLLQVRGNHDLDTKNIQTEKNILQKYSQENNRVYDAYCS